MTCTLHRLKEKYTFELINAVLPETEKKNYALRRSRRRVRRIHHENRMVWQSSGVFVHQQHHGAAAAVAVRMKQRRVADAQRLDPILFKIYSCLC